MRDRIAIALAGLALGGCCGAGAAARPHTPAELAAEAEAQRARAGAGFASAIVSPFVVIGNGGVDAVRADALVVAWARDLLKRDFFERDPGVIITIWSFPDESSYRSGASAIFGSVPSTPYGYYSPCRRALVMNVGYGYGTMVHEIVHAFMDANFSAAPVWLNEGLGSLFEAPSCVDERGVEDADLGCASRGHIRGRVNWRLDALKRALASGRAPSWERMAGAGRFAFDGKEGPLLYAAARYTLYWLQEKGLLLRYFRAFQRDHGRDSDGLETLRAVLGGGSLAAQRSEWERFVTAL